MLTLLLSQAVAGLPQGIVRPIHNSLDDLGSLVSCLRVPLFNQSWQFHRHVTRMTLLAESVPFAHVEDTVSGFPNLPMNHSVEKQYFRCFSNAQEPRTIIQINSNFDSPIFQPLLRDYPKAFRIRGVVSSLSILRYRSGK